MPQPENADPGPKNRSGRTRSRCYHAEWTESVEDAMAGTFAAGRNRPPGPLA
jgi:hypothetical protein